MGLSNEERYERLVHTTNRLTELGKTLPNDKKFLKELIEGLWPALLKGHRNSLFWFFGGSGNSDRVTQDNLLGLILLSHKYKEKDEFAAQLESDYSWRNYSEQALSVENLLSFHDNWGDPGKVYEILQTTESSTYAIRRYKDEFEEGFEEYNNLICRIQGECFRLLTTGGDSVLRAWLQSKILEKMLTWEDDDVVNSWWKSQTLWHGLRMLEYPFTIGVKRLTEIFASVQFKKPTVPERVYIIIELLGPRWHHAYEHKHALRLFEEYNQKEGVPKIDINKVKEGIALCIKKNDERKLERANRYNSTSYCSLTEQTRPMEEPLKEPEVPVAPKKAAAKPKKKAAAKPKKKAAAKPKRKDEKYWPTLIR